MTKETPAWAQEAGRLLDEWAAANVELRRLEERAEQYRQEHEAANDRVRTARETFDRFMNSQMRALVLDAER